MPRSYLIAWTWCWSWHWTRIITCLCQVWEPTLRYHKFGYQSIGLVIHPLRFHASSAILGGQRQKGLTHWGRATHICVGNLATIGSDNGLLPGRCQAIIWTNAGTLLIGLLGTNFNEILIEIPAFSFTKIHLKMLSGKWRPFCLGLNGRDRMAAISQTTYPSAFPRMKTFEFYIKFDWNMFLKI